jgi:hypothetical protein
MKKKNDETREMAFQHYFPEIPLEHILLFSLEVPEVSIVCGQDVGDGYDYDYYGSIEGMS